MVASQVFGCKPPTEADDPLCTVMIDHLRTFGLWLPCRQSWGHNFPMFPLMALRQLFGRVKLGGSAKWLRLALVFQRQRALSACQKRDPFGLSDAGPGWHPFGFPGSESLLRIQTAPGVAPSTCCLTRNLGSDSKSGTRPEKCVSLVPFGTARKKKHKGFPQKDQTVKWRFGKKVALLEYQPQDADV